jgi:hypothetical protein
MKDILCFFSDLITGDFMRKYMRFTYLYLLVLDLRKRDYLIRDTNLKSRKRFKR